MNPWIRRLAMMLGIVVPGLLLIFLQVPAMLTIPVLVLAAVAILVAARSITVADLKGVGKRGAGTPAGEAAGQDLPGASMGDQLREFPSAFRDLAGLFGGRRRRSRAEHSTLDAIDRELELAVAGGSRKGSPATVRRPVSRAEREDTPGPGGDPFLDLLDGALDPALLGNEMMVAGASGPALPREKGAGPGSMRTPGTGDRPTAPAPGLEIQFGDMETLSAGISLAGKAGGIPPAPGSGVTPPKEAVPADSAQQVNLPGTSEGLEMISFAKGSGGSMDDLLAALKEEASAVKRKDDTSLMRALKGVPIQGKDLVDELTSVLKTWRK